MTNLTHQPDQSHENLTTQDEVIQVFAQRLSIVASCLQQLQAIVERQEFDQEQNVDLTGHFEPITSIHKQIQAGREKLEAGEINLSDESLVNSQRDYTEQALGALSQMPQPEVDAKFDEIVEENPILAQAMRDISKSARSSQEIRHDFEETARQ